MCTDDQVQRELDMLEIVSEGHSLIAQKLRVEMSAVRLRHQLCEVQRDPACSLESIARLRHKLADNAAHQARIDVKLARVADRLKADLEQRRASIMDALTDLIDGVFSAAADGTVTKNSSFNRWPDDEPLLEHEIVLNLGDLGQNPFGNGRHGFSLDFDVVSGR